MSGDVMTVHSRKFQSAETRLLFFGKLAVWSGLKNNYTKIMHINAAYCKFFIIIQIK